MGIMTTINSNNQKLKTHFLDNTINKEILIAWDYLVMVKCLMHGCIFLLKALPVCSRPIAPAQPSGPPAAASLDG